MFHLKIYSLRLFLIVSPFLFLCLSFALIVLSALKLISTPYSIFLITRIRFILFVKHCDSILSKNFVNFSIQVFSSEKSCCRQK